MPLVSANPANIWQHCAACGANNRIPLSSIELGTSVGTRVDPNAILLPACDCGAREVVLRTWDTAPMAIAGTHLDTHRKLVNGVAQKLKTTNRSHAAAASIHAAETTEPPDQAAFPFAPTSPPHGAPAAKAGRA